jgi:hypothetical protein
MGAHGTNGGGRARRPPPAEGRPYGLETTQPLPVASNALLLQSGCTRRTLDLAATQLLLLTYSEKAQAASTELLVSSSTRTPLRKKSAVTAKVCVAAAPPANVPTAVRPLIVDAI